MAGGHPPRGTSQRLALLADETSIELGRLESNLVVLGAAALLMTRELGVSLGGAA